MRIKIISLMAVLVSVSSVSAETVKWPEPPTNNQSTVERHNRKNKEVRSVRLAPSLQQHDETPLNILPEIPTEVRMSSTDVNRVVCQSEIKDVLFSKEKGVNVKITGKDAYIKFTVLKTSEGRAYSKTPTEMFVVCGDSTYSLIVLPQPMGAQTIRLSSGLEKRIKANQELYSGLPFERRVLKVIKDVYTENIPESYSVKQENVKTGKYKELDIIFRRSLDVEGEGLKVKEFELMLKPNQPEFKINEKMFLHKTFAENPIAISLEKQILKKGETVRMFIVEQRPEKLATMKGSEHFDKMLSLESGATGQSSVSSTQNKQSNQSGDVPRDVVLPKGGAK